MAKIIQRKNYLFGIFLFFMILCVSGSKVLAQTEVSIESLNSSLFPFIYSHVSVKSYGNSVTGLTRNDFQVFENNNLQTEYFEVTPPETGGGVRLADIVFLIDVSGSMGPEIADVRNNVNNFANALTASNIDFRLGLVRFGNWSGANPYLFNNGNLTGDVSIFHGFVNTLYASGGYEPGFRAIRRAITGFNFRPGAQKVFIIITDEDSDDRNKQQTIDMLLANSITVHAAVNCGFGSSRSDYCNDTSVRGVTGGLLFGVRSSYNAILDTIVETTSSTYVVRYKSSNPNFDGTLRNVEIFGTAYGETDSDTASYIPGAAPQIALTSDTEALFFNPPVEGTALTISAVITDDVPPGVTFARLYYKAKNDSSFQSVNMTNFSGNFWEGEIPGSSGQYPGIEFYITATDGQASSSLPKGDPSLHPFNVAVLPNELPIITHTSPIIALNDQPVEIAADISDTTYDLQSVKLFYRKKGEIQYAEIGVSVGLTSYEFRENIPAEMVTSDGVEYYITATDDLNVTAYHGTPDFPHEIKEVNPFQRLLDLMNDKFDFYEEYYNYDDDLDCSIGNPPTLCSDPEKSNVLELQDDDIWIVYLYPIAVGFMQGDDLSCQIDGNAWYKGPDPRGKRVPELELDVSDYIPNLPGSNTVRDLLQLLEGGVTLSGAVAHALHECEGEHEAEIPVRIEAMLSTVGLPVDVPADSEFCIFYNAKTDDLGCDDPDTLDAGIQTSLSKISRHYERKVLGVTAKVDVDFLPKIGLKCNMRMALQGPKSPVAIVPAVAGFIEVDSTGSIETELPVSAELVISGNSYMIIESLYCSEPISSIKSPYYDELDKVNYCNLEAGDTGFRVHFKPDLTLVVTIHLPPYLGGDVHEEWPLPIPELEHTAGKCKIRACSPVDLHVYDSMGRHVGLTDGQIQNMIKYSNYIEIGHEKVITIPSSVNRINVVVVGKEHGTYDLHINNLLDITTLDGNNTFTSMQFNMTNISITAGEFDYLDIDFNKIRTQIQAKVNMGVKIDEAIQNTVSSLDFDKDGIADVIDHSLDFDERQPSLVTGDVEATEGQDVNLEAKLHFLGDPVGDAEILFFVDDNPMGSTKTDVFGIGRLNYQVPIDLNVGEHSLRIVFLGNEQYGQCDTTATITIVNLPPHIQLMNPSDGETLSGNVSITGQIRDTDLAFQSLKIDRSEVNTILPYDWDTRKYDNGLHLIELVAGDTFGNISTEKRLVYISNLVSGDLDGDGDVDRDDLNIILSHRNEPASVCPECDLDSDGMITALDSRKLVTMCTRPRCACE